MLSVIVSTIFIGMIITHILFSIKAYQLKKQLEGKRLYVSNWSWRAAVKDLKQVINTSSDEAAKKIASKIINLRQIAFLLFLCSIGLIFLIFFINGIFKLGL